MVAILHDLNLAAAYGDVLLMMEAGRIVARGTPETVMRDDLVARVFGVPWRVGEVPRSRQPFILPQRGVAARSQD